MSETVVKDFKVKHGLVVADGGTFGGTVTVATPTELFHAATKAYVDANAGGNASIQVSDVAPSNPETGNAWFDSTTGRFYIYFDLTWVEIGGSGGGSGGGGNFTLSETAPEDPVAGDTWFNTTIAILYVYYDDFWVEVSAGKAGPTGPMFLDYQGAWSNTIGYNENDGVSYNGSLWRLDQPTSAPGTIPSTPDWQLVVQKGDKGDTGELSIGTVTTVVNGTPATVTNSGTTTDAILDFEIPAGPRSTIEIGTVTTVTNGTPATVTNSGDESDAVFDFEIPAGPRSTIEIGTVTTGDYSSQVTVTNSGTSSDAIFDISIPQGIPGDFVVSETPPENPLEGHVWYDSTRAKAYIYYDSFWVEYAPGFVGPQGPAGQDAVLNILGEYNNFYDYQIDDVVTYNGSLYIRIGEPNTGYAPTDTNYWTLIVQAGQDGQDGATGQDGAPGEPGRFYASDTAPANPETGDAWFDSSSAKLFMYYDSSWIEVSGADGQDGKFYVSETEPESPTPGDAWFNAGTTKFFIYYDSFWVEFGTSIQGPQGATGPSGPQGPVGPTGPAPDTSTFATKTYADNAAAAAAASIIDSAPSTLDTLNELAAALADDQNFATTVISELSNKADATDTTLQVNVQIQTPTTQGSKGTVDFVAYPNRIGIYYYASAIAPISAGETVYWTGIDAATAEYNSQWSYQLDNVNFVVVSNSTTEVADKFLLILDGSISSYDASLWNTTSPFWYYDVGSTSATIVSSATKTISPTEISYLDGVTSEIQTQINSKASLVSPTFSGTVTAQTFSGAATGLTGQADNLTAGSLGGGINITTYVNMTTIPANTNTKIAKLSPYSDGMYAIYIHWDSGFYPDGVTNYYWSSSLAGITGIASASGDNSYYNASPQQQLFVSGTQHHRNTNAPTFWMYSDSASANYGNLSLYINVPNATKFQNLQVVVKKLF